MQETVEPLAITFPCNKLSDQLVATALGWKKSAPGVSSSMRNGTLNTCLFTGTSNEGSVSAVISYSDPITIENKYLERSFKNTLARANDKMSVKAVPTTLGDEAIYSYGEQGPNIVFKLQWRRGNSVEYSISYRADKPYDEDVMLERLETLAQKLQ